ncbi:hypothetical protein ACFFRR_008938 [Megaselia abdita]
MFQKNLFLLCCLLIANLKDVISQKIENFESTGVYFKHMGELLTETDSFILSSFIRLEPYHQAIDVIQKASTEYKQQCVTLKDNSNCDQDFKEIMASHDDLVKRLDNIYGILQEKPPQRKKRSLQFSTFNTTQKVGNRKKRFIPLILGGVLGGFLFIGNRKRTAQLAKDVENMQKYMDTNFKNIDEALKNQNNILRELTTQQNNLQAKLNVHERKLFDISKRIDNLEKTTSELSNKVDSIQMRVIFQNLKIDVLEILGKLRELEQWMLDLTKNILHPEIVSPESITDGMQSFKLSSGRFLASPNLNNYPLITETMTGSAFISLKTIFVNIRIPIYQEDRLNVYKVIKVPMIRPNKILRIANNQDNYCVFSEDKEQYSCSTLNKLIKGKNFYFDDGEISLLSTKTARGICIVNIFTESSLDSCRYEEINQNLEIMEEIDTHKYLFAVRDQTSYFYECQESKAIANNYDKDAHLQGTGLLYLKPDCVFEMGSGETYFKTSSEVKNKWDSNDIYQFKYLEDDVDSKFSNFKFSEFVAKEKTKVNFDMLDEMAGL